MEADILTKLVFPPEGVDGSMFPKGVLLLPWENIRWEIDNGKVVGYTRYDEQINPSAKHEQTKPIHNSGGNPEG